MVIKIDGRRWLIKRVKPTNKVLDGDYGACDFTTSTIYISNIIDSNLAKDTIIHELAHAFLFVEGHVQFENYSEENVCDFFGSFGLKLINTANKVFEKWCIE